MISLPRVRTGSHASRSQDEITTDAEALQWKHRSVLSSNESPQERFLEKDEKTGESLSSESRLQYNRLTADHNSLKSGELNPERWLSGRKQRFAKPS